MIHRLGQIHNLDKLTGDGASSLADGYIRSIEDLEFVNPVLDPFGLIH
jgi:hypothetical protein